MNSSSCICHLSSYHQMVCQRLSSKLIKDMEQLWDSTFFFLYTCNNLDHMDNQFYNLTGTNFKINEDGVEQMQLFGFTVSLSLLSNLSNLI